MDKIVENAYQRKKDPEGVKKLILANTMSLVAEHGVNGVSIQSIATRSGVTKGGVFHHFANKQVLIEAMLEELIQQLDQQVSLAIEQDPVTYGCFTRAYIAVTLSSSFGVNTVWSALSMTLMTDITPWSYPKLKPPREARQAAPRTYPELKSPLTPSGPYEGIISNASTPRVPLSSCSTVVSSSFDF